MASYIGPFSDPNDFYKDFNINDCSVSPNFDGIAAAAGVGASSGAILGPGSAFDCNRTTNYSWTCGPSYGVRVLDGLYYSRSDNATGTFTEWRDPANPPPLPPPYIVGGNPVPNLTSSNTSCGFYRRPYSSFLIGYPQYLLYVAGRWRWYGYSIGIAMTFWDMPTLPEDICPEGTVFNPNTGTCEPLPGWEWDGELGEYIPKYCLSIEPLNDVYEGYTLYFVIYVEPSGIYLNQDVIVDLSYDDSRATLGEDFFGPSSIVMEQGTREYILKIKTKKDYIPEGTEFVHIRISTAGDTVDNVTICTEYAIGSIVESGSSSSRSDDSTCCNYFSMFYEDWQSCERLPAPKYPGDTYK